MPRDDAASLDASHVGGIDLTIVVPVFNRAHLVTRCLQSCLAHTHENVEVVVVDDASTDDTVETVKSIEDKRLRLFVQDKNQGVCSARGRGAEEARGRWVAFVDSDDELFDGAIETLFTAMAECPEECGAIYHRDRHASGVISPVTVVKYGVLGYIDYIELMSVNLHHYKDVFQCMRKSALEEVPWPRNRAPETEFHLNFLQRFPIFMREAVLYKVNEDSDDRLSQSLGRSFLRSETEFERLVSIERILESHGEGLGAHGPALWENMLSNLLSLEIMFGRRDKLREFYLYGLRSGASKLRLTLLYVLGFLGPKAIFLLRNWYKSLRDLAVSRKSAPT